MLAVQRRTVLKLALGGAACTMFSGRPDDTATASTLPDGTAKASVQAVGGDTIMVHFDHQLRTQVSLRGGPMTGFDASETVTLANGRTIREFAYTTSRASTITDRRHGKGVRHTVVGRSREGLEKKVQITCYERFNGLAVMKVTYRNTSSQSISITGWTNGAHVLRQTPSGFVTFSGATHGDRRDWVRPVTAGFNQQNSLGMVESDYGGGTPVASLWRRGAGLTVGHLESTVRPHLSMPVEKVARGASIAMQGQRTHTLKPGIAFTTDTTFLIAHTGDHFGPLRIYRDYLGDDGLRAPEAPASALSPIWCAWGYEREFTVEQILGTLPKVREVGLEWAVLDDGWQTNEGDWELNPKKFPNGDADMRAFVAELRRAGLKPRLWLCPLAADPQSKLYRTRSDMALLDVAGKPQEVTWWDSWTLCPAYEPTVEYFVSLVKKIIGDWGFEGLKLDGQHLNAVAPCYNPQHRHRRPEESCEGLADFFEALRTAAHEINPNAVMELCPCGTAFSFHNLPHTDQFPSSDPESSFQIRSKGKTMKALMGRGSSYAGDHVELSDGGNDFASSYGIGAVLSTKFTWPKDTDKPVEGLPPGGYVLTPAKQKTWTQWVELYKKNMLPKGEYLGDLYDIGFDKPEAHVIAKDEELHYAFYAPTWHGTVSLHGLGAGTYRLTDPLTGRSLGAVTAQANTVRLRFSGHQLIVAHR